MDQMDTYLRDIALMWISVSSLYLIAHKEAVTSDVWLAFISLLSSSHDDLKQTTCSSTITRASLKVLIELRRKLVKVCTGAFCVIRTIFRIQPNKSFDNFADFRNWDLIMDQWSCRGEFAIAVKAALFVSVSSMVACLRTSFTVQPEYPRAAPERGVLCACLGSEILKLPVSGKEPRFQSRRPQNWPAECATLEFQQHNSICAC